MKSPETGQGKSTFQKILEKAVPVAAEKLRRLPDGRLKKLGTWAVVGLVSVAAGTEVYNTISREGNGTNVRLVYPHRTAKQLEDLPKPFQVRKTAHVGDTERTLIKRAYPDLLTSDVPGANRAIESTEQAIDDQTPVVKGNDGEDVHTGIVQDKHTYTVPTEPTKVEGQ
jgi:hypothetical protein